MDNFKNPLETLQLIPIFSYLNILSDFLFIENYLSEIDQNKQIPIINALYEYIQDYENNTFKKGELIRELLKGSDLYGAKDDEYVDVTFVNVMFDHIISSLVFHKYGNIYGFLANIFRQAENLQIQVVLNRIILDLENASFENEYGDSSTLSFLAVGRIYNDIILPLFPIPKVNLSLLSIDYIYAQAGSMFLRAGRINTNNYIKFENNVANPTEDNLFDQYLITGHVIEKLIFTDQKNFEILKSFALPALTYYVFNSKYLFEYENMANLISESVFWQTAYEHLFQFIIKASNDIKVKLNNDYTLKMHAALSSFQSKVALAKTFMDEYCSHLDKEERDSGFLFYLHYPKSFYCVIDKRLPDPNESFKNQLNSLIELYKKFNFQLVQEAFPKSLIENLEHVKVIIKLLLPNHLEEHGDFLKAEYLSYDLLEFSFPDNVSENYYLLKTEDYNVILSNAIDNSQILKEGTMLHIEKLFNTTTYKILKTAEENFSLFIENFVNYKKSRLELYLNFLGNYQEKNELKNDWWKEFGLSLVPYYPCLIDTSGTNYGNICKSNKIKLFFKYENDISLKAINNSTQNFLSSLGTNFKSVFLKFTISKTVHKFLNEQQKSRLTLKNLLNKIELFEDICLHIKDPSFQLTFITKDDINVLERIINSLREKFDFSFTSIINNLSNISTLKSNLYKSVGTIGENDSRLIFINTLNIQSNTGYGYKFIFLSDDVSKIAQLRTGYELKDERLFTQGDTENAIKKYIALNNVSFKPEPDHSMYEINSKLWRRPTKLMFSGIPIQADDYNEKCNDIKNLQIWKIINICRRQQRFNEKSTYEEETIKLITNKTNIPEERIRNVFDKFTFPDKLALTHFINDWLKNNSFEAPLWSRIYKIENSDLLKKLKYDSRFEEHDISNFDGEFRINALYSKAERRQIEEEAPLKNIIKEYNQQKASYSVAFHDYYAIQNYATTGYTRITRDTQEAKLMKIALYKLAIRQSDDPEGEFDLKLFKVETKPIAIAKLFSTQNNITLQKFTQASPNAGSAIRLGGYPAPGCINILYEMVFSRPYVRAKIEQIYNIKENNVILLPGSSFLIVDRRMLGIGGLGNVLKLKLMFQHIDNENYFWYKNIMNEIVHIKF
ncbi:uncharacterized protein LOC127280332 [Leptopilina boulardi]|uniref:uncharacterized protein LOC127280332 n=1 Tax=Leptopilina boulardi TaxID=63433 RepID=UPI0021F55D3F|nr:uncharacterized protein LOC127280332 [Leptopilina boulardi]XP_051159205.1 uncharacterized protein LOC127280332 [Leptopilina boulardi]XP_051159206.1 uncharacterized protein LOC127280332 [Leptopilina boulardi]